MTQYSHRSCYLALYSYYYFYLVTFCHTLSQTDQLSGALALQLSPVGALVFPTRPSFRSSDRSTVVAGLPDHNTLKMYIKLHTTTSTTPRLQKPYKPTSSNLYHLISRNLNSDSTQLTTTGVFVTFFF